MFNVYVTLWSMFAPHSAYCQDKAKNENHLQLPLIANKATERDIGSTLNKTRAPYGPLTVKTLLY